MEDMWGNICNVAGLELENISDLQSSSVVLTAGRGPQVTAKRQERWEKLHNYAATTPGQLRIASSEVIRRKGSA